MSRSAFNTLSVVVCLLLSVTIRSQSSSSDMSAMSSMSDMSNTSSSAATPTFPTSLLNTYAVDIHFVSGHPTWQSLAYHFCYPLYTGYFQCDVYNGTANDSLLVGSEIIVSADIFQTFTMEERKLWHSHAFAIQNGLFVLPEVPADQELAVLQSIIDTYGKVTNFVPYGQDLPVGAPELAFGLADQSQINSTTTDMFDQALNLNTTYQERTTQRANLTAAAIIEGANDYLSSGDYPQYEIDSDVGSDSGSSSSNATMSSEVIMSSDATE